MIYQQGWGAEKTTRPGQYRFPALRSVYNKTTGAQISIENQKPENTQMVYDVDRVAIETLEKDYGSLVARRVGGIAAKAVVSDQIRQKNQLLGDLTWIAMNLTDRADLRQWSTLPSSFQIAKIYLKPGTYKIKLEGLDSTGVFTGENLEKEITIKANNNTFLNWRSLQ